MKDVLLDVLGFELVDALVFVLVDELALYLLMLLLWYLSRYSVMSLLNLKHLFVSLSNKNFSM